MSSRYSTRRGRSSFGEDFQFEAVTAHKFPTTVDVSTFHNDMQGLGVCDDLATALHGELSYLDNSQAPRSNTASNGFRTRSGPPTRRTDSPFSISKSRVSKSPVSRSMKDKKSKLDKFKTPRLMAPLSVLTKDMSVPMKDMDAWVNRSLERRREEVEKRNGYVTRPMNSFMLYRSAYAERTKAWCTQNNHQIVSSVSGESWPMESQEVRDRFNEWAKVERNNHQAAHPDYKFSPSKSVTKRRKCDYSDDEAEVSSIDGNPDDNYRPTGRNVRQRKYVSPIQQSYRIDETVDFDSHPYYDQQATHDSPFDSPSANAAQMLSSHTQTRIVYDAQGLAYDLHTGQYIQQDMQKLFEDPYGQNGEGVHMSVPQGILDSSVGGYGLPGGRNMAMEDLIASSYGSTTIQPLEQYYQQSSVAQQLYEHQQWLEAQCQPHVAIDPCLEAELTALSEHGNPYPQQGNHFEYMLDSLPANEVPEYFEEYSSPNGALAPAWNPMEELQ